MQGVRRQLDLWPQQEAQQLQEVRWQLGAPTTSFAGNARSRAVAAVAFVSTRSSAPRARSASAQEAARLVQGVRQGLRTGCGSPPASDSRQTSMHSSFVGVAERVVKNTKTFGGNTLEQIPNCWRRSPWRAQPAALLDGGFRSDWVAAGLNLRPIGIPKKN